jgi:hypothetical protein
VVRLRSAGWLIGIPPLALGLRFLSDADLDGLTGTFTTDFLRSEFAFWDSGAASDFRVRIALNLVLFLVAGITCLVAVAAAAGRTVVIVVAAVQAVVALSGLIWDFAARRDLPPEFVLRTMPVSWGRYTSFFYLVIALTALGLALSVPTTRPVQPVQTF